MGLDVAYYLDLSGRYSILLHYLSRVAASGGTEEGEGVIDTSSSRLAWLVMKGSVSRAGGRLPGPPFFLAVAKH